MSDFDIHKSWAEEVEESQARRPTKEKMKFDSRENSRDRKKMKPNAKDDGPYAKPSRPVRKALEMETNPDVLQRRQKQIDYGKNTVGYHKYIMEVPLEKRTKEHAKTPDKYLKYSRRSWDMLIKIWRKKLHAYDTKNTGPSDYEDSESSENEN